MTDSEQASVVGGQPFVEGGGGVGGRSGGANSSGDVRGQEVARQQPPPFRENATGPRKGKEDGQKEQAAGQGDTGKPEGPNPAQQEIAKQAGEGVVSDPRAGLEAIADPDSKNGNQKKMTEAEEQYLANFDPKKQAGLKERYHDERILRVGDEAAALSVRAILKKRANGEVLTGWEIDVLLVNQKNSSLTQETKEQLDNLSLSDEEKKTHKQWQEFSDRQLVNEEDRRALRQMLESQVRLLFLNKEGSIYNQKKAEMVSWEVNQYLDLIFAAQAEGSISSVLTVGQVFELVRGNIEILALQDRAASENLLGDHGVRHLIDHNIRVSMMLADELEKQGVKVRAIDRLVLHQAMIFHDLGYAVAPVRGAINQEGVKGQDAGHNVLAARYFRERVANSSDVLRSVFGEEERSLIHRGILYHDKNETGKALIEFDMRQDQTEESRRKNIESIIRTADNTHAFEDKLPELLYQIPETLKIMRLLRTAGEVGDEGMIDNLKSQLAALIQSQDISEDDKKALLMTARSLNKDSWIFNVNRICGNKPLYKIDENGRLHITVYVSEIHQEVIGLFGGDSYQQLVKMIKDVYDQSLEGDLPVRIEANGHILEKRERGEESDYQRALRELLGGDEEFRKFINQDRRLDQQLAVVEKRIQGGKGDQERLSELKNRIIAEKRKLLQVFIRK